MASFRAEVKPISRTKSTTKKGQNAVAAAAYRAGEELTDTNKYNPDATTHDYSKKTDVMSKNIILPKSLADQDFSIDRQTLWSAVEQHEVTQRGNKMKATARVAREWLLSLPHELSDAENIALAEEFAQKMADDLGVIADCCIHNPKLSSRAKEDDRNIHAHIMFTTRKATMTADGKLALSNKADSELDGTARKAKGLVKEHDYIKQVRSDWANMVNKRLLEHGISTVSSLSYKERNLDILPQTHHGRDYKADAKREHNYDIIRRNELVFKSRVDIVERFASAANESANSISRSTETSAKRLAYSERHVASSKQRLDISERHVESFNTLAERANQIFARPIRPSLDLIEQAISKYWSIEEWRPTIQKSDWAGGGTRPNPEPDPSDDFNHRQQVMIENIQKHLIGLDGDSVSSDSLRRTLADPENKQLLTLLTDPEREQAEFERPVAPVSIEVPIVAIEPIERDDEPQQTRKSAPTPRNTPNW